jgi:hypothetical protein
MTEEDTLRALQTKIVTGRVKHFYSNHPTLNYYYLYYINNKQSTKYNGFGDCLSDMLAIASEIEFDDTIDYSETKSCKLWDFASDVTKKLNDFEINYTFKFYIDLNGCYKVLAESGQVLLL